MHGLHLNIQTHTHAHVHTLRCDNGTRSHIRQAELSAFIHEIESNTHGDQRGSGSAVHWPCAAVQFSCTFAVLQCGGASGDKMTACDRTNDDDAVLAGSVPYC